MSPVHDFLSGEIEVIPQRSNDKIESLNQSIEQTIPLRNSDSGKSSTMSAYRDNTPRISTNSENPEDVDHILSLEVETLRGLQSPPQKSTTPPESAYIFSNQDNESPFADSLQLIKSPASAHEVSQQQNSEDAQNSDFRDDNVFPKDLHLNNCKEKRKFLNSFDNEIIRDAIMRFSTKNPRKWVDECKEELHSKYGIPIGSSSLTTRKCREK